MSANVRDRSELDILRGDRDLGGGPSVCLVQSCRPTIVRRTATITATGTANRAVHTATLAATSMTRTAAVWMILVPFTPVPNMEGGRSIVRTPPEFLWRRPPISVMRAFAKPRKAPISAAKRTGCDRHIGISILSVAYSRVYPQVRRIGNGQPLPEDRVLTRGVVLAFSLRSSDRRRFFSWSGKEEL